MCDKNVDNYPFALEFFPERYKIQTICDEAVDTCPSTIQFVPEWYKTQEMFYKADQRCFVFCFCFFFSIPDQYKTQEICEIFISLYPFY